jgi:hypothetical protein
MTHLDRWDQPSAQVRGLADAMARDPVGHGFGGEDPGPVAVCCRRVIARAALQRAGDRLPRSS